MKNIENIILRKNVIVFFTLIGLIFITSSCSKDEIMDEVAEEEVMNPDNEGEETSSLTPLQRRTIAYFTDIALGFEFGNESEITRKWKTDLNVFVRGGNANQELLDELNRIIVEINELATDGFHINIVDTPSESNYEIFFGSHIDYGALYPNLVTIIDANWGYFNLSFNNQNEYIQGKMYVDTQRANMVEQKHLLREEFTQSLGLARDSEQYEDSIFQQRWTTITEFSNLDKELIRLLYHTDMKTGLDKNDVIDLLKNILLAE